MGWLLKQEIPASGAQRAQFQSERSGICTGRRHEMPLRQAEIREKGGADGKNKE